MLFLLFLCIYLFVTQHSVDSHIGFSCRPSYKENLVYLMYPSRDHPNYESIKKMNKKITTQCGDFYNIQSKLYTKTGVSETLKQIQYGRDIINLWAEDYYNYRFKEVDHNKLIYAGDIVYLEPKETEKRTGEDKHIIKSKDYKKTAKVVSHTVAKIEHGDLLEFIESIQYNGANNITFRQSCTRQATNTTELRIVLICTDGWNSCFQSNEPYHRNLHFKVVPTKECRRYLEHLKNNLLAVLAPKPFDLEYEVSIPMIFYETPFMNSEYETYFPNSMNLISGLLLKYAFMKFINDAEWQRVGFISDTSPYSVEFEKELLDMFHQQGIIYKVRRCENSNDFEKAVVYFNSVDTKIIIVNADENNSKVLIKVMKSKLALTNFVLLFRVPIFWPANYKNNNMHWFSIILAAADLGIDNCSHPIKSPTCAGVVQALSIVSKAHTRMVHSDGEDLQRAIFYKKFTNTMKSLVYPGSTAHVKHVLHDISELHIRNDGVITVNSHQHPFTSPIPDQNECMAKVNNFENPCDYNIYLYIMFVIMMFAVTALVITCYFHDTSPLFSKRYQQF